MNTPKLTLINTAPMTKLPQESASDFKRWVLEDGMKPSAALRLLMEKYQCNKLDPYVPIELLQITYPELDTARRGFGFRIIDSAYPASDTAQFSDNDFDDGIAELLSLPPGW